MANLLNETMQAIVKSGHDIPDVVFIGSERGGYQCTMEEFVVLADHEYDSGYGAAHVATDLIIVFSDGQQMRRGEYDGSEWWEFSSPFIMPTEKKPITKLVGNDELWSNLAAMNEEE